MVAGELGEDDVRRVALDHGRDDAVDEVHVEDGAQ